MPTGRSAATIDLAHPALRHSCYFRGMRAKPAVRENAMPSIDQVIVWIIVGLLGGSLAGLIINWDRKGFGLLRNLGLGLVGALLGGLLFRLFDLWPALDKISISLRDVVAAVAGSLIVLAGLWLWRRFGPAD
jgi:uncharacterized membrane protein YeaQ/YmgE (transglycosylase-associated protein family)